MGFLSTPKPKLVEPLPPPPPEDTSKILDEKNKVKALSLNRYIQRTSSLGANELRGTSISQINTGIRP